MAFVVFNLLATAALIGIDQAIKLWATNVLQPVGAMPLIPHVVELRFVLNPGMAFSLLSGKQLFLIIATSIALIFVAYGLFFRSRGRYLQQAALLLILAGGIGNLIDRVLNGEVVDYINLLFMQFAVFNFADICVCVGVGLWVLEIFLEELHGGDGLLGVNLYLVVLVPGVAAKGADDRQESMQDAAVVAVAVNRLIAPDAGRILDLLGNLITVRRFIQ